MPYVRARSVFRSSAPAVGLIIPLNLARTALGTGTSQVSSGVHGLKGEFTPAVLATAGIFKNGVQVQCYLEGLGALRAADGTFETILVQLPPATVGSLTYAPLAANATSGVYELRTNITPLARLTKWDTTTPAYPQGVPDAILYRSTDDMCGAATCGVLIPKYRDPTTYSESLYAIQRVEYWDDYNWQNMADPAAVLPAGEGYYQQYNRGIANYEYLVRQFHQFCRTGDPKWFRRMCLMATCYNATSGDQTNPFGADNQNTYFINPSGHLAHYLMTGDTRSQTMLAYQADSMGLSWQARTPSGAVGGNGTYALHIPSTYAYYTSHGNDSNQNDGRVRGRTLGVFNAAERAGAPYFTAGATRYGSTTFVGYISYLSATFASYSGGKKRDEIAWIDCKDAQDPVSGWWPIAWYCPWSAGGAYPTQYCDKSFMDSGIMGHYEHEFGRTTGIDRSLIATASKAITDWIETQDKWGTPTQAYRYVTRTGGAGGNPPGNPSDNTSLAILSTRASICYHAEILRGGGSDTAYAQPFRDACTAIVVNESLWQNAGAYREYFDEASCNIYVGWAQLNGVFA